MNTYSSKKFINHFITAHNAHGIHSPFVFDLYNHVIKHKSWADDFKDIELLRQELLQDKTEILTTDLGSGSLILPNPKRKIADIARHFSSPAKDARFFYRLAQYLKPNTILELGTSLGITSIYLAKAAPNARIISLEGCPETAKIANANFKKVGVDNIEVVVGNIDMTLCSTFPRIGKIDLAYIDANHSYDATLRYFNQLIDDCHNESCLIFDDIYQKEEMTAAWKEICNNSRINVALDFFNFGIVFPRAEQRKQYFKLRF